MSVTKNVKDMSNYELLNFGSEISTYNELIHKEWYKRYQMNFPYMLDLHQNVIHALLGDQISDEHCDKLILEQANKLRSEQNGKVS